MSSDFTSLLNLHEPSNKRAANTQDKLLEIKKEFQECDYFTYKEIQVFCAGSLGRGDVGDKSDLDLFVVSDISNSDRKRLEDLEVLAKLISINRKLNFPPFSNDGQFLKIHSISEMTRKLGDPSDDSENLFTTRMLMLLESKPIYNEDLYLKHLEKIVSHYIRDKQGHTEFKPIFIINDLLRYWRTLCLNYEIIRNDSEREWRKKNINLKFSRALTVFSAVLVMLNIKEIDDEKLLNIFKLTPMERLAYGLDLINDIKMLDDYKIILDDYESFLKWKEQDDLHDDYKRHAKEVASRFSDFLYRSLMHESIDKDLKKILVI